MIDSLARLASWLADPLFLAGAVIVAGGLVTRFAFRDRPIGRFASRLAFFIALTIVLIVAGVIPYEPTSATDGTTQRFVVTLYKIAWWLAAAWLLSGFFRAFVIFGSQPRETRFLQDVVAGLIYLGAGFAVIAYAFGMPVSGLLATSGAIAIVLGLALQSTLGDLFSGVVLNFAKPFHPGDWVTLDGDTEGSVIETNWRATHILMPSKDVAIVPNSVIARAKLRVNHPASSHGMSITVQLNPSVAPAVACATLEAVLLSSNRILHKPRPTVTVKALNAVALDCELYFFVPDLDAATGAQNELFELVHRHCAASGLRLGPPSDSPFVVAPASVEPMRREAPRQMIDRLSILAPLTEAERASLAAKLRRRSYKTGETIIEPGSVPQTLFILGSGVLLATDKQGEEEVELFRLGPGDCFGEAGVLAGSPTRERISALTRAVVYALSKEDLAAILKERPGIATELGQILARREATGRERLREHLHRRKHQENLPEQLAERMKTLFHLE